jgi:cation diffusion facilitator CzcD-associated flavoprotein CzcO
MGSRNTPKVAIIGAGFSGIAAGVELRRNGIHDFTIFDKAGDFGGTWWWARYPGAEVDLESHLYSYSFARHDWSGTHAGWAELQGYLANVADEWGLRRHLAPGSTVTSVEWRADTCRYAVTVEETGETQLFDAVISAVGYLNRPNVPPFAAEPHVFDGQICHTASWDPEIDMAGKSVAVVGTSASAVQVVTAAQKVAKDVTVFQIEPNWLLPRHAREYSPDEREKMARPLHYARERLRLYLRYDRIQRRLSHARSDGRHNRRRKAESLHYIRETLKDRPDLLEVSVPEFPMEARRTVLTDTYLQALCEPNVQLVPHAVVELAPEGVVDATGAKHEADIVVLATGYRTEEYLSTYRVTGVDGIDLQEQWAGEPTAFLGMMVPHFPNFFIMMGPNTNAVPLVAFYEAQARFAAKRIKGLRRRYATVEVRESAYRRYDRWVQSRLNKSVWVKTDSYFRGRTGRVLSQWPGSPTSYLLGTRLLGAPAIRRSGKPGQAG